MGTKRELTFRKREERERERFRILRREARKRDIP